jgi:hypothetical protein
VADDHLVVIPTDPSWVPDEIALRRAVRLVRQLAPAARDVRGTRHDEVVFVDAGESTDRVECPACGSELEPGWWSERMARAARHGFARLGVTTPCCETATSLDALRYGSAAGFARAEVRARRPERDELSEEELARVAGVLGHTVRQVRARS